MREGLHLNKCKTNHCHGVRSFTWSSEQLPLPLCSPDCTPGIAANCYITALGPTVGRGCKSTSRKSMRKRRPEGKSELRSWSCCLFSSLSSRNNTIGLVIYFSCSHRFFKEVTRSGKGESLPLLLSSACWLSFMRIPWIFHTGPFQAALCKRNCWTFQ